MSGKLKDYQVLDVLCGGTFYKVRHKVTNNIFAWKAYDCTALSDRQIRNVVNEVKTISRVPSGSLLRYYDSILHAPSKTLYFVLEYKSWQSLEELIVVCKDSDKYIAESFVWYLLHELAKLCKAVESLHLVVLRRCLSPAAIFVSESCQLRVDCFELSPASPRAPDVLRQAGGVLRALCLPGDVDQHSCYSDDLHDVISFLTDERNSGLRPDVLLYHPTVLSNLETQTGPKHLKEILISIVRTQTTSITNKCDSEKAVELCRGIEPAPRTHKNLLDSPIYCNITTLRKEIKESSSARNSLSPTIAALALELPGFIPRSRKPFTQALEPYKPQKVSEDTLSQQWMSRLITLRQREASLNKRERELIAKEIVNSPATKVIPLDDSKSSEFNVDSNGITLPPMLTQGEVKGVRASRRRPRRPSSVRTRSRRTFAYEDLDSSLSADPGDGSVIITATKFTADNMPRRNIFPDIATKKVHFTSANPFVESDESVTLTFYELDNVDKEGYQVPRQEEKVLSDINKFKYLDLEKLTTEKRAAMQWNKSSPSKLQKMTNTVFSDITNIRKTPSKCSLASKGSGSSRYSMVSAKSQCSLDSGQVSEGSVSERTRASVRQSVVATPIAPDMKKSKRRSLLPFKTPFKFMTSSSTKV